jgi:hypothetical protein
MRTIKFRGYNAKNKEWLYGFYLQNRGHHFVCPDEFAPEGRSWDDYEVVPESVGQFTGICESGSYQDGVADDEQLGGRMVYEGDIIIAGGEYEKPVVVVFYECMFGLAPIKEYEFLKLGSHPYLNDYAHLPLLGDFPTQGEVKVIGNVFDNPHMDLTTESDERRIIIIGEHEMQDRTAEYDRMFNGDAMTPADLREALLCVADPNNSEHYQEQGKEFGYSVSPQWPDRCHCFRVVYHGKYASVFKYWLGKA